MADSIYVIGHPSINATYSTIIQHYDLKKMGLAWIQYNDSHRLLVDEIKNIVINS